MHTHAEHLGGIVYRAVDHLSVTQAAAIGGSGSAASAVSVLSLSDGAVASWLQIFTLGMGAIGAILSVGLLILKFVQQRREMTKWEEKNDSEHEVFTEAQRVSVADREDLHHRSDALSGRLDTMESCSNFRPDGQKPAKAKADS